MNQFFSRVTVVILTIAFTYSFSTVAVAAEVVPLPDLPVLIPPEKSHDTIAENFSYQSSIAVLRENVRKSCQWAMESARDATEAYRKFEAFKNSPAFNDGGTTGDFSREGERIFEDYVREHTAYTLFKRQCEISTSLLNHQLAAEEDRHDSDELFDPTNPQTAQWAGSWNVRSKHNYGPAKGGSFPSQFTVEIFWHGCEVTWNVQEMYDCNVNGRTLTFWGFHNDDGKNRMDWTFFHSGLDLKGEFSGTIRGTPAGGTYTGKKAGY